MTIPVWMLLGFASWTLLVHVCFVQTNTAVSFRFSFLTVQLFGFVGLIGIIVTSLSGSS